MIPSGSDELEADLQKNINDRRTASMGLVLAREPPTELTVVHISSSSCFRGLTEKVLLTATLGHVCAGGGLWSPSLYFGLISVVSTVVSHNHIWTALGSHVCGWAWRRTRRMVRFLFRLNSPVFTERRPTRAYTPDRFMLVDPNAMRTSSRSNNPPSPHRGSRNTDGPDRTTHTPWFP